MKQKGKKLAWSRNYLFFLLGSNLSSGDGHNDRHMRQPESTVREHHVTEIELGHIQELGSHKAQSSSNPK